MTSLEWRPDGKGITLKDALNFIALSLVLAVGYNNGIVSEYLVDDGTCIHTLASFGNEAISALYWIEKPFIER